MTTGVWSGLHHQLKGGAAPRYTARPVAYGSEPDALRIVPTRTASLASLPHALNHQGEAMLKETWRENLRDARIDAGLSQRRLGRLSGHSPSTIANIERGPQTPSFRVAVDIARALHVDLNDLVRRSR
jgi:DNA-binding XRE family transcriptional regulator